LALDMGPGTPLDHAAGFSFGWCIAKFFAVVTHTTQRGRVFPVVADFGTEKEPLFPSPQLKRE
jgi:hypothetical protein